MTHDGEFPLARSSGDWRLEDPIPDTLDTNRDPRRNGSTVTIIYAVPEDILAIKLIADRAKVSLGFVHRGALARAITRREVLLALDTNDVIGFCHFYRRRDGVSVIYHLAVETTARRAGIGRRLTEAVLADARQHLATVVRLKCPEDLEANSFYESIGFSRGGIEIRQPRSLILWERATIKSEV